MPSLIHGIIESSLPLDVSFGERLPSRHPAQLAENGQLSPEKSITLRTVSSNVRKASCVFGLMDLTTSPAISSGNFQCLESSAFMLALVSKRTTARRGRESSAMEKI